MSALNVYYDHVLVGHHDPRCEELREGRDNTYHRRHEGNALVVHEAGHETRYQADQWSAADVDLACGFTDPDPGCRNCHP